MELTVQGDQGGSYSQKRVLEMRELYRERTPEICRGCPLSIRLITEQQIHVSTHYPRLGKGLLRRISRNSAWYSIHVRFGQTLFLLASLLK